MASMWASHACDVDKGRGDHTIQTLIPELKHTGPRTSADRKTRSSVEGSETSHTTIWVEIEQSMEILTRPRTGRVTERITVMC